MVPRSAPLNGNEELSLFEVHRASTVGDSRCPAAAATVGAEAAETGNRSGFTGFALLDETSGPTASGSGQGSVYDNTRIASVDMQTGSAEPTGFFSREKKKKKKKHQ